MEKQVIIDTAFECWQAGMFSTTSLAPLARALGVTKAAIYRHFDDKESLVNAMEASFSAAYRANLDTHRSNLEQSDLEEGVRLWITGLIDLFRRNPGFLRYFISRIYHRRLETSRPLFRTLEEEAALLRKLFARRGYDEKASREIVKYLYTHLCGWGLFLEEDPSGGVPPIVDSFFTGFIESEGGIDYEAVEAELAAFGFDRSPATHRILEALLTVVAREGFAGTTISHIAEEAGYSKSSLYSFFKNKNAMLQSILRQHTEAFNRLYREHVGEELDMNERVYRLILLQFRYLEQNRAFLVALGWLRFRNLRLAGDEKLSWLKPLPDFIDFLMDERCRSFGLDGRTRFGLLWFQLIREISELCLPDYQADNRELEDKYHLRYLHLLYCRGLEGFQERRIA